MKLQIDVSLGTNPVLGRKSIKVYKISSGDHCLLAKCKIGDSDAKLRLDTQGAKYLLITANLQLPESPRKEKLLLLTIVKCRRSKCGQKVTLNELSTVANVYAFTNFFHFCNKGFNVKGKPDMLKLALRMRQNLVLDNGQVSEVLLGNPNGLETNAYPLLNSLANFIYSSYLNLEVRSKFLELTNSQNITQGMWNLSQNPFQNSDELYLLANILNPIFVPALTTLNLPSWKKAVPDGWTLAVKFNRSGSENFLIGGPGYVTFDHKDRVWVNNNTRQGTPNSSTFCTVLKSNGQPKSFSPIFGGGLLGAGFGIAASPDKKKIAVGNFGWGTTDYNPQYGSISLLTSKGEVISPSNGYINGFDRAQGVYYDCEGNLWIAAWGDQNPLGSFSGSTFEFPSTNSAVVVYIKGNPNKFDRYEFDSEFHHTFDVVADTEGNVYVSNAGDIGEKVKSSIYHFRLENDKIVMKNSWTSDFGENGVEGFRQVAIGPDNNVYQTALISSRVLQFSKDLTPLNAFSNKIDGAWGIAFDPEGTMFVSNFRKDTEVVDPSTFDMAGKFGVTIIRNYDDDTAELATLPTGGDQIILANGFPLYGSNSSPSYEPLMRITGSAFDRIGNLWSVNNWKPALINDLAGNPGGDGVVVFIGIGKGFAQ